MSRLNEIYREYSVAIFDDLIRFCRSKVFAGRRGGNGIHVDTAALSPTFWFMNFNQNKWRKKINVQFRYTWIF